MMSGNIREIRCSNSGCLEEVDPKRFALGLTTCIWCGSDEPRRTISIPYNKGAYQLITDDGLDEMRKE